MFPEKEKTDTITHAEEENTPTTSPERPRAARSTSETTPRPDQPPVGAGLVPARWLNSELDHFVRTITRPVLTIGGAAVWVWFIVAGVNYPPAFQWLVIASWLEWFGERAVKRLIALGGPK